jgi:hypothetical protein
MCDDGDVEFRLGVVGLYHDSPPKLVSEVLRERFNFRFFLWSMRGFMIQNERDRNVCTRMKTNWTPKICKNFNSSQKYLTS